MMPRNAGSVTPRRLTRAASAAGLAGSARATPPAVAEQPAAISVRAPARTAAERRPGHPCARLGASGACEIETNRTSDTARNGDNPPVCSTARGDGNGGADDRSSVPITPAPSPIRALSVHRPLPNGVDIVDDAFLVLAPGLGSPSVGRFPLADGPDSEERDEQPERE